MAQDSQYLAIHIGDTSFLLHGAVSLAIEKRNSLLPKTESNKAAAWRKHKKGNWPAYALDSDLNLSSADVWQRAVFIPATPHPVGLAADEIELLSDEEINPEPFTPVGCQIPGVGCLFSSAWVNQGRVHLVLDADKLALYLQSLGQAG